MLVHGYVRGEEPFPAGRVFRFRLSVERVYLAPRTGHGGPVVRRHLTTVVVGHPRMDITAFHADFPFLFDMVP